MEKYNFEEFREWIETGREIEFTYHHLRYSVTYFIENGKEYISFTEFYKEPVDFDTTENFMNNAKIDGVLLKDIWDSVTDIDIY